MHICGVRAAVRQRMRGHSVVPQITLDKYECLIAADVISPTEIDVDFNSIGALHDVKSASPSGSSSQFYLRD